ncbi:MAG: response regulator [Candidatus Saccharimonadales bacterium]
MPAIKTILLIEDDRFIGEMYQRSLQSAGYTTDWTVTGKDGAVAATTKQYDLILLDIMLPEASGVVVLDVLRSEMDKIPKSRVIIMTNFDQDEDVRQAMQKKVDGYLIKADITPRKLIDIISQMTTVE